LVINKSEMNISRNTILITEGAGGLGLGFAHKLVELGNTVIITAGNADKLKKAKQMLPAVHTMHLDGSGAESVAYLRESVVNAFPGLNMLINNPGEAANLVFHQNRVLYDITREIEYNLTGPVCMIEHFLPHLQSKAVAAILNITSGISLRPYKPLQNGSDGKTELRSYTQCLREHLKHTPVKVFELATCFADSFSAPFIPTDVFTAHQFLAPANVIDYTITRLKADCYEINPSLTNQLRVRSLLAADSFLHN
jgi:uncharacterized oxidoreductase